MTSPWGARTAGYDQQARHLDALPPALAPVRRPRPASATTRAVWLADLDLACVQSGTAGRFVFVPGSASHPHNKAGRVDAEKTSRTWRTPRPERISPSGRVLRSRLVYPTHRRRTRPSPSMVRGADGPPASCDSAAVERPRPVAGPCAALDQQDGPPPP